MAPKVPEPPITKSEISRSGKRLILRRLPPNNVPKVPPARAITAATSPCPPLRRIPITRLESAGMIVGTWIPILLTGCVENRTIAATTIIQILTAGTRKIPETAIARYTR
jgi:hypothetical protein